MGKDALEEEEEGLPPSPTLTRGHQHEGHNKKTGHQFQPLAASSASDSESQAEEEDPSLPSGSQRNKLKDLSQSTQRPSAQGHQQVVIRGNGRAARGLLRNQVSCCAKFI